MRVNEDKLDGLVEELFVKCIYPVSAYYVGLIDSRYRKDLEAESKQLLKEALLASGKIQGWR